MRRSTPRKQAPAAARYCSRENTKRDIDENSAKDRGQSVGPAAALAEIARGRNSTLRVMSKDRRNIERYPARNRS